jgi:hypothetical protein
MQILTVQGGNGLVRFLRIGHFYKRKATRFARVAIADQVNPVDLPVTSE